MTSTAAHTHARSATTKYDVFEPVQVTAGMRHVAEETKPDVRKLLNFPSERYFRGEAPDRGSYFGLRFSF